jgi:TolB protein
MSLRDGNWEVYLIDVNGSGLRNLSESPSSRDGLASFSPDGKLVAFVSDRGGNWATWAVRTDGSGLTKLFDLPAPPTGDWTDEHISWGP